MHHLRFFEDIDYGVIQVRANIDYLIESQSITTYAQLCDGNLEARKIDVNRRETENPKSILILRAGGAGDLLFLTPTLRALRQKFPVAHITLGAFGKFHWIIDGNSDVTAFQDFPLNLHLTKRYDWVIDLEDAVETNNIEHVVDIFAAKCGVELTDKRAIYQPKFSPKSFDAQCPKIKRRVALQFCASSPVRSYPHVVNLMNRLRSAGWEVALFAEPGAVNFAGPRNDLINTGELGWTWQQTTDFLQTCDVAVGPDSSLVHFAGALNIPTVALYGSFDAKLRVAYAPSVKAIQATGKCAPCFSHGRRGILFPKDGLCNSVDSPVPFEQCVVLGSITPEEIVREVEARYQETFD